MSKATNYWRRQLSREVANIGGYFTGGEKFPLEWTVRCIPDLDCQSIRTSLVEGDWFQNEADMMLQYPDFDEWYAKQYDDTPFSDNRLYDMARDQVVDDLHDDDGVRMWSPKVAAGVLFDYTGDGSDRPFDMNLETRGRGGKHVVLMRFEGFRLEGMSNSEFINMIESMSEEGGADQEYISNKLVRQLLGMLRELNQWLTTSNAEANALYYATDRVYQDLIGEP